jgi:hypothetical protein
MKKGILLTLIIITIASFNCLLYGSNTKNYKEKNGIEGIIANIQEEYKKINKELYLVARKRLMGQTTEGGELLCYCDKDNNIKKAIVTFYKETGNLQRTYYYKEGKLILALEKIVDYDKPFYIQGFLEDKIETNIYYFHHQSLIKWTYREENPKLYIDKITTLDKDPHTPEAQKIANELLIEAQEFLKEKLEQNEEW